MRWFTRLISAALMCLVIAAPVSARVDGGCGQGGFDRVLLADVSSYPSVQRGLEAGLYTEEDLAAQVESLDRNNNGYLCVKDVYAHNGGKGTFEFYVSAVDDNAAPKD